MAERLGRGVRAMAGDFASAVGQNIFAGICATAIAVGCAAAGIVKSADTTDPANWKAWLVTAFSGAAFALFGGNTLRLAIRRFAAKSAVRKASGERIALMVARLDGDAQGMRRDGLRDLIKRELGEAVHITLWPDALILAEGRDADAEARAHKTAQAWLKRKNCDLLVWGAVRSDQTVALRFTSRDSAGAHTPYAFGADAMEIPETLQADLFAAIAARIVAEAAPAYSGSRFIVPLLRKVAARIDPVARQVKNGRVGGEVRHSYAAVLMRIGAQAGTASDLNAAVPAIDTTLDAFDRACFPFEWATIKNNQGVALMMLSEGDKDTARLHQAIIACRDAARGFAECQAPLRWAGAQSNLANALTRLGERESNTALLREAIAACRDALEPCTRRRAPREWAMIQNDLGSALRNLGEREDETGPLAEAVVAYREVLKERTRRRTPLGWAATQNNLGNVLWGLGKREDGVRSLKAAIVAYRNALKERKRNRVPLDWAATQNNLGNALNSLGRRKNSAALLRKAAVAYREALKERTQGRVPLDWAATENNLGNALTSLGEWEGSLARLQEAVTAYRNALTIYTHEKMPHHSQMITGNLNRTLDLIRQHAGDDGSPALNPTYAKS